ncbi:MAG: NADH-dependent dehydrogenase, partial [uncultured Gemmatimonadetes bacterium]
ERSPVRSAACGNEHGSHFRTPALTHSRTSPPHSRTGVPGRRLDRPQSHGGHREGGLRARRRRRRHVSGDDRRGEGIRAGRGGGGRARCAARHEPGRHRHRHAQQNARRAVHPRAERRRRRVLPEAAWPHRGRGARRRRRRPRGGSPARGRPFLPLHRGDARHPRAHRSRRAGPGVRGGPRLPQRLRPRQALVLRSRAFRRRLRDGPGRSPGGSRPVDAGLSRGGERPLAPVRGRRAAGPRRGPVRRLRVGDGGPGGRDDGAAGLLVEAFRRAGRGDRRLVLRHGRRRGAQERRRLVLRLHRRGVSRHLARNAGDAAGRVGWARGGGLGAAPVAGRALRRRGRAAGGRGRRPGPHLRAM